MNNSSILAELNRFLTDAIDIFRLRIQSLDYYHYNHRYTLYIPLFILSIINAPSLTQMGSTIRLDIDINTAMILSLVITYLRVTILTFTITTVLKIKKAQVVNVYFFILLTEFINIPTVILRQIPILDIFTPIWSMWILWVQIQGLLKISGQNIQNIFRAYIIYFLIIFAISIVVSIVLVGTGIIDADTLNNIQLLLQNMAKDSS